MENKKRKVKEQKEREKLGVIVKKSKIQGEGAFANREFKIGEIVNKWHPKLLSKDDLNQLPKEERKNIVFLEGKYLLMQEPENKVNHSCNPNTKIKDFCDVAIKKIKKGDEITSDYSGTFAEGESLICNCGEKCCKKVIK